MDELYLIERLGELERTVAKMGDRILQLEGKGKNTVDPTNIHAVYELWCRIYGANMDGKHWNVKDIKDFAIHYANQSITPDCNHKWKYVGQQFNGHRECTVCGIIEPY